MIVSDWDVQLERNIIARALKDQRFARRAAGALTQLQFSDRYCRWIWGIIVETNEKAKELPDPAVWASRLDSDFEDEDEAELHAAQLMILVEKEIDGSTSSLEEIKRFVRMTAARGAIDQAEQSIYKGNVDEAEGALAEGVRLSKLAAAETEPTTLDGWQNRLRAYSGEIDPIIKIPSGLRCLNKIWSGGYHAGTAVIVCAYVHIGKSTFAVSEGFHALKHGAVVAHFSVEETASAVQTRYDAVITGISKERLSDLKGDDLITFHSTWSRVSPEIVNRLRIYGVEPKSSILGVTAQVEELRDEFPGKPLFVLIDTPDGLSGSKGSAREGLRVSQVDTWWRVKAMANSERLAPIVVVSTTHVQREWEDKPIPARGLAETQEKFKSCDALFSMWRPSEIQLVDGSVIRMMDVLKDRIAGKSGQRWYLSANLGTCRFEQSTDAFDLIQDAMGGAR